MFAELICIKSVQNHLQNSLYKHPPSQTRTWTFQYVWWGTSAFQLRQTKLWKWPGTLSKRWEQAMCSPQDTQWWEFAWGENLTKEALCAFSAQGMVLWSGAFCGLVLWSLEWKLTLWNAAWTLSVKVQLLHPLERDRASEVQIARNTPLRGVLCPPPPPPTAKISASGVSGMGRALWREGGCSCGTLATHSKLRKEQRQGCSYTLERN